jgi:PAS domain S-box-containing protein
MVVDKQEQEEERLQKENNRLKSIFENAGVGIARVDLNGRIVIANTKFAEITNRTREELLNLSIQDITYPGDIPYIKNALKQVAENNSVIFEKRYVLPDSSIIWVNHNLSLIKDENAGPEYILAVVQDVTASKTKNEELRLSENKLLALINQAAVGIIQIDVNGMIFFANQRYCNIVGREIEDLINTSIFDITHPDDLPWNRELYKRMIAEGEGFVIEKRYIKPDKSIVWVNKSVSLVRSEEGEPMFVLAIVQDITDRKQIEHVLRLNENRLQALIGQAAVGIIQIDLDSRIIFANPRYCEIVGRRFEDLVNISVYDITHPDDFKKNRELYAKTLETGEGFNLEKRYVKPDGSIVWVNKSVSLVQNEKGEPMFVLAVVQDVTERKRIQEELILNEGRLTGLINQAAVGITQMDLEGRIFFANKRYCDIVGRKFEELINTSVYDITHPDDLKKNKEYYVKTVKDGKGFVLEKRYRKPDGSIVWVNKSVSLVKDEKGNPQFVVGVVQDITDRKLAEQGLIAAHEKLEQKVRERTAELASSNQALMEEIIERKRTEEKLKEAQKELIQAEKLSALGRVATNIAHEIRNPLANISASSQYIIKKFGKQSDINALLEIIIRNTDTANDKIKELLDFASPRSLTLTEGNIGALLKDVSALVSARCLQNNVKCKLNIPRKTLPPVKFNAKKLEEALLNLLTNALDAMPEGGDLDIKVKYNKGNEVDIYITDTGCGIAEENLDKVFEPFFTTKHTGVGLGLSLVHQIITLHKGKMNIESIEGRGTTIHIQLPVK